MAETTTKKMNSLAQMTAIVLNELEKRKDIILQSGFTNSSRCFYIITNKNEYILKWSKEMYRSINYFPEFKGKGAGMTINKEFVDHIHALSTSVMLFATIDTNDSVYGLRLNEFKDKAVEHEQPANGEMVYAIPVKLLDKFC